MRLSHQIAFASTSRDKFEEFDEIISAYPEVTLVPASAFVRNIEKLELVEKAETYAENAAAKARFVNLACHLPALADDTGLEVEGLGGKPGVRSRRFSQAQPGQSQSDANIEKLLGELRGKSGPARNARFVTTVTLTIEGILIEATGVLEGTIIDTPRGTGGFGYDSVFVPKGATKTLAEMSLQEKNSFSHRARAIQDLMALAKARGIVFAKP